MKKFSFNLQKVLDYKVRLYEVAKEEYFVELRKLQELQQQFERLRDEYMKCLQKTGERTKTAFNIKELAFFYRYVFHLKREMKVVVADMEKQGVVVEEKRRKLVEATKAKEVLETLREKRKQQYLYQIDFEEQKVMDDLSSAKFARSVSGF